MPIPGHHGGDCLMSNMQFRSLQFQQFLGIQGVFPEVAKCSTVFIFPEDDIQGKVTTPSLDFSASLTSHRQLMPRLKSSYLAFSWRGGCNLQLVNFTFITLNFVCHLQPSQLCSTMLFHSCSPCSLIYHLEQLSISKLCCSHSFPGHL